MDSRDRWLRTSEIAEEMGLMPETVRRFIREGYLRAMTVRAGERTIYRVVPCVRPGHVQRRLGVAAA